MYRAEQNPTYQIDSLTKEIKTTLSAKAESLADKILSCSRPELSNLQTFFAWCRNWSVFVEFCHKWRPKHVYFLEISLILFDAAGMSPILVLNENANAKKGS